MTVIPILDSANRIVPMPACQKRGKASTGRIDLFIGTNRIGSGTRCDSKLGKRRVRMNNRSVQHTVTQGTCRDCMGPRKSRQMAVFMPIFWEWRNACSKITNHYIGIIYAPLNQRRLYTNLSSHHTYQNAVFNPTPLFPPFLKLGLQFLIPTFHSVNLLCPLTTGGPLSAR